MNMKKYFMGMMVSLFGFGKPREKRARGDYARIKTSKPKIGSWNNLMKLFREHEHGTMSRIIARNNVKMYKRDDVKDRGRQRIKLAHG